MIRHITEPHGGNHPKAQVIHLAMVSAGTRRSEAQRLVSLVRKLRRTAALRSTD